MSARHASPGCPEAGLLQSIHSFPAAHAGLGASARLPDACVCNFSFVTMPCTVQTQWLLVALCQDQPKNKALEAFREGAYRAALEGKWVGRTNTGGALQLEQQLLPV